MGGHLAVPSTLEHYFHVRKHMGSAFASKASHCMWTSAVLVVGLPVGYFPDCTPCFFRQVAAHVDVSGKVGWEGFDSEGRQGGPHSHLSSGLVTFELVPKLWGILCMLR